MSIGRAVRRLARLRSGELGGLAGDSFYTAIWLGAVSVADLIQIALVTHTLGLEEFGRLALVMSVVVLIGQFFDVRVGTAETSFGAGRIAAHDWRGVAGVFRFGYGIDGVTGVVGFAVVALAAPLVGPWLIGENGMQWVLLFGLTLLASTLDDSSATLLRLLGRFRLLAFYMSGMEVIRVMAVALALLIDRGITAVLIALVLYDILGGIVNLLVARRVFYRTTGQPLLGRSYEGFSERRAMVLTVFHTNVVSYARIAQVQLPTLLLGALTTPTQVGLYKVGASAGSIVGRVADPVYASTLPRLSRLLALHKRDDIVRLLRHATPIAAVVVGGTLVLLIVFASPILRLIGGAGAVEAKPVLVLVGVGYAVNAVLFWNTPLLFASGRSGTVSVIAIVSAVLQIALLVPLAVAFDATGAAIAMCVSLVASNLVAGFFALRALRNAPYNDSIISNQRATASLFE